MSCGKVSVGDKGQRFEVRYKSYPEYEDKTFGWSDDHRAVRAMLDSANLMPSGCSAYVIDRVSGPLCAKCQERMGHDPIKRWDHCPQCNTYVDFVTHNEVSEAVVKAMRRFNQALKERKARES